LGEFVFTGIIEAVGQISETKTLGDGLRLTIDCPEFDLNDVRLGDSIAIQGACMTVVEFDPKAHWFAVDVSRESLNKTVGLDQKRAVNLEKALALGDRLGGHLVSGHVDGLGRVLVFEEIAESWRLDILVPKGLHKYFAIKGSAVINGVSLTTNTVVDREDGAVISINLIPHTIAVTTLKDLKAGDSVNLEIDLIARYMERMMSAV
jgi:riboflavin synthase